MNDLQKLQNEMYFDKIIKYTKEGGIYMWPDEGEIYTIQNSNLFGSQSAIDKIRKITPSKFHSKLKTK
jgi:hypothetical protein